MANPALNIALIAAAQQQAASDKEIKGQLLKVGATSPRRATTLDLSTSGADKMLAYLVKSGHVRDMGGGRYWLDQEAIARSTERGHRVALLLLAFLASAGVSLVALLLAR